MTLDSESFEINRWHSPEYVDSWMADKVREADRRILRKKLVSSLPFEAGDNIRVLDVGAGTGRLSLEILSYYPHACLVCQDFSESMLSHARLQLAQFSKQITFVKSDLRDPEWWRIIEGTFDAVVSSLVMHTVSDRVREIYREIFGLVSSGGCFLTCDTFTPPGPALEKAYRKARLIAYQANLKAETGVEKSLEEVEQELREKRQKRRASFPNRERRRLLGLPNFMNHLEWLSQAGFDEVDCLWKDMRRAVIGGFRH